MTSDPQLRVLDGVAKLPGSVHDARIFKESNLWKKATGNAITKISYIF